MEITYLGHAGFCVETRETIVVADPWLSPGGAFDGAWFQFPRNHHLAAWVRDKLSDASKERYLYISHEHKDHFDRRFLDSLPCRDFTLVIPKFRRAILRESFGDYHCGRMVAFDHEQVLPIPGGELTLYLDDSELNRDSAILIRADGRTFLNMNDCKLYDALPKIRDAQGTIDAFACQFSGATWHPTCYDYPPDEYRRIAKKKRDAKFETVARSIEALRPTYYLPSAGPACFLDPQLMHLNFEPESIFPRAHDFLDFLDQRLPDRDTEWNDWMPGDSLDLDGAGFVASAPARVTRDSCAAYLQSYANDYKEYFAGMQQAFNLGELAAHRVRLQACLLEKLEHLPLRARVPVPLYFGFTDVPTPLLRVDFPEKRVTLADAVAEQDFYSIVAPAWQVVRVLEGLLTWEDFALTFRMRLNRSPDLYQALIQAFLIMEADDLEWFCAKLQSLEELRSRIVVEANGGHYRIDKFCPHQGGDLSTGWAEGSHWTCPRHRWQFDLDKEGQCTTSNCTINAIALQPD